jgi:PEP-CTERM motif
MKLGLLCAAVAVALSSAPASAVAIFQDDAHVAASSGTWVGLFPTEYRYNIDVSKTAALSPSDRTTETLTTSDYPLFGVLGVTEGAVSAWLDLFELDAGALLNNAYVSSHQAASNNWYESAATNSTFFVGLVGGTNPLLRDAFGWAQFQVDEHNKLSLIHSYIAYGAEGVNIGGNAVVAEVPEPASIALVAAGLGFMGFAAKRRQKQTVSIRA